VVSTVKATILLPFKSDLSKEPLIIRNLRKEAELILKNMRISQLSELLSLPLIGTVTAEFDRVPAAGETAVFNIDFQNRHYTPNGANLSDDDGAIFYRPISLPLEEWDDYWDRIYVDEGLKQSALNYCVFMHNLGAGTLSKMALAQHRLLIFYGPPGTGKTTLVRGLANEVAKNLKTKGTGSLLYIEIPSHKLSSLWLGEGPKLVEKAFSKIDELASSGLPVICLIDEVESLITERALALSESNPVDVFRAVNEVLQQVDRLSERPNVYTLATSNFPKAIDKGFFDRADLRICIDLPDLVMRERIFKDIFEELNLKLGTNIAIPAATEERSSEWSRLLEQTAHLSGRQLRKLVTQAIVHDRLVADRPEKLQLEHILQTLTARKSSFIDEY